MFLLRKQPAVGRVSSRKRESGTCSATRRRGHKRVNLKYGKRKEKSIRHGAYSSSTPTTSRWCRQTVKDERGTWVAVLLRLSSISRSFFLATSSASHLGTMSAEAAAVMGYKLPTSALSVVWSDEFNEEEIDTDLWTVLKGDGCDSRLGCGWGRGQFVTSSPSNVSMRKGHLIITARQSDSGNDYPPTWSSTTKLSSSISSALPAHGATAARVSTFGSADFMYGRVDIRAKMPPGGWGGLAGVWLVPSEGNAANGYQSCTRVDLMEVSDAEMSSVSAGLHFGDIKSGCKSSASWPVEGGSCTFLTPSYELGLGDSFHVYSVEWEEGKFRWFVDGWHYCTKSAWFSTSGQFPEPFNKAFHVEMGLEVVALEDSSGRDNAGHEVPLPQELIVDYVRIMQGSTGEWRNTPGEFDLNTADAQVRNSWAFEKVVELMAFAGCFLGPYMAMTGLSRPRTNTILLGVETGAFKAANASYLITDSAAVALLTGMIFGAMAGWLAVRSQAFARWNTVAGLAVPVLFLLIDVGMISDIGSRYVCWAIFSVLSISFSVLAFLPEHHAVSFGVATAATGGCVFKLGLGWLLGLPGEIFKILDDPLGDTCEASRSCRALTWISVLTFAVGVTVQFCRRPSSESTCVRVELEPSDALHEAIANNNRNSNSDEVGGVDAYATSETSMLTPPQPAVGSASRIRYGQAVIHERTDKYIKNSTLAYGYAISGGHHDEADLDGEQEDEHRKVQTLERRVRSIERQQDSSTSPNGWKEAFTNAKSVFRWAGHPFFSRKLESETVPTLLDGPTPVPMPAANTMVSSQGDTIELVVHSPTEPLGHQYFRWGKREKGARDANSMDNGRAKGRGKARLRSPLAVEANSGHEHHHGHHHVTTRPGFTLPTSARSASPSERSADEVSCDGNRESSSSQASGSMFNSGSSSGCSSSSPSPPRSSCADDTAVSTGAHSTGGRLARAFSQKWASWASITKNAHQGEEDDDMDLGGQVEQQEKQQQRERWICKQRSAAGTTPTTSGGNGEAGQRNGITRAVSGCRRARQFDAEALLLSPYSPNPVGGNVDSKSSTLSRLPPALMATEKDDILPPNPPPPGASAHEFWAHSPPPAQGHHLSPVYEQLSDTDSKKCSTTDIATAASVVGGGEDVVGDAAADNRDLHDTDLHVVTQQAVLEQRPPSRSARRSHSSDRRAKYPGESYADESFPVAVATLAGDGVCGRGVQREGCPNMREEGARKGAPIGFVPEVVSDGISTRRTDDGSDDVTDSTIDYVASRVIGCAANYVRPQDPLETYPDITMARSPSGERTRLDSSEGGNRGRPRARQSRSGRTASHRRTISPAASSEDGGRSPSVSSSTSMSPSHFPATTTTRLKQQRSLSVSGVGTGRSSIVVAAVAVSTQQPTAQRAATAGSGARENFAHVMSPTTSKETSAENGRAREKKDYSDRNDLPSSSRPRGRS